MTGEDHARQGGEDQPAEVCPEEDDAGAPPGEIDLLRQPGVAGGELERDEVAHGPRAEVEQLQVVLGGEEEEEGREEGHEEAGEDEGAGGEGGGEQDPGETRRIR